MRAQIVDVKQGSDEWHSMRRETIGASEVATLFGCNPWQTLNQLLVAKFEPPVTRKATSSQARGHKLEQVMRQQYELCFGTDIRNTDYVLRDGQMSCSLDAVDSLNECVVEMKAPNAEVVRMARDGMCPVYYWLQIQMQMLLSGIDEARYIVHNGDFIVAAVSYQAESATQDLMVKAIESFWQRKVKLTGCDLETEIRGRLLF
jgi:putative phage-type endonuclease